jgi:hypothetical protein
MQAEWMGTESKNFWLAYRVFLLTLLCIQLYGIEPTFNSRLAFMTLMQYAQSPFVEGDWMVRYLVGKPTGPIDEHDLEQAKTILQTKCWVGMQNRMVNSLARFGAIYGWNQLPEWPECLELYRGGKRRSNSNQNKPILSRGSEEWDILAQVNQFDMKLFAFAKDLFEEQGQMYFSSFESYSR